MGIPGRKSIRLAWGMAVAENRACGEFAGTLQAELRAVGQGTPQSGFVCIFQIVPDGDAFGDTGQFDRQRSGLFGNEESGSVP